MLSKQRHPMIESRRYFVFFFFFFFFLDHVFYPVCLILCNVQFSRRRFGALFGSPFSFILSPCSSPDSGHLGCPQMLRMSSIPQSDAP